MNIDVPISKVLGESKAIDILLALQDESKHIRGLQRNLGGSLSTIELRVEKLIQADLIQEVEIGGPTRRLELTHKGRNLINFLKIMDLPPRKLSVEELQLEGKERWILILLYTLGQINSNTRLEKLLFLLKERFKVVEEDFYNFRPNIFGPYSPEVSEDARVLHDARLIEISERILGTLELSDWIFLKKTHRLVDKGRKRAQIFYDEVKEKTEVKEALWILREYNAIPLNNLLSRIYKMYPEYSRTDNMV